MGWRRFEWIEIGADMLTNPVESLGIMEGCFHHRAEGGDFETAAGIAQLISELRIAQDFTTQRAGGTADELGSQF